MYKANIFRAYDIRGIYLEEFDLKGANVIGKAYGTYMLKLYPEKKDLRVVVGRDGRTHSEDIQKQFIAGLISTGIEVTNIGLSPSPLLYYSICKGEFDGGVNITASHNPKEYNGFKLQKKEADSIFGDDIKEVLELCDSGDFVESDSPIEEKHGTYFPQYLKKINSLAKIDPSKKKKIIIDAGNGVAGPFASLLYKFMGYEVIELYCNIDGNFPNHAADPEDESTLADLKKQCIKQKADLGIAFDGDGDRIGVVDSEGNAYNADKLLILLARDIIKRKGPQTVIYELNITSLLAEEVEKLGGKAIMSKTGHSYVEHEMKIHDAILGGENSGHLFFGEDYYGVDDALLAGALIAKILLHDHNLPVADHFKNLPETHEFNKKYKVSDDKKFNIIELIAKELSSKYEVNRLDGVRIEFEERAWCVIRASNTSPKIQLKIESRSQGQLDKLEEELTCVITSVLTKLNSSSDQEHSS